MKTIRIVLICILLSGGGAFASAFTLTPYNAIAFVYKHLKSLNIRAILLHSRGPERKKLQATIQAMRKNSRHYWALKRQSDSMKGYEIRVREVYEEVAAVYYYWKIVKMVPVKPGSHLRRAVTVKVPFKTLLRKIGNRWYLIATRSMKPWQEIGPQDYRRKMIKKYGKKKRVTVF